MKKTIPILFLGALVCSTFAGAQKVKQPPEPTNIAEDLYDSTDRWQAMFGLDGKLKVSAGRRDARGTPADGAEICSFVAEPVQAGWYVFTFIRIDNRHRPYQVHTVRLHVFEGAKNATTPLISPVMDSNQAVVSAAPGSKVKLTWSYNPGGEGIRGGWKMMSTDYCAAKLPPAVPGYGTVTGE